MKGKWAVPVIASILILSSVGLTQDILTQAFAGANPEDIVYENGNPNPSDGLYIDMAITANDFELEDDSELTDVHFILQDDTGNGLNVPIQYEIREHNVDRPSNVVVPFGSGTAINVHTEQIEPCTEPFTCERLLVWFDFEQPIPLDGGVTYWLILHAGNDINDNTERFFFWEQSDVNLGFQTVSFFIDEPDELIFIFDTWFQLTSKQTSEEPRTIGFWKNHPDDTEEHLPIAIGDLVVEDSDEANEVFNVDANNAHDMLAAQLLAAEINVWHGVPSCDDVDDAISDAQSELAGADYTGPGTTTAPQKGDKGAVNAIKDVLDDFNNNGCS